MSIVPCPAEIRNYRKKELNIHVSSVQNSAPTVADLVDGNNKAFKFVGSGVVNRLYGYVDLQHDYVAGTDLDLHIHWCPDSATGGNVKWQFYIQWTEEGDVWQPATLLSVVTAAGTVAWADKKSSVTISGVGHTWGSRMRVHIFRDGSDAADTFTGGASLLALGCHYTAKLADTGGYV